MLSTETQRSAVAAARWWWQRGRARDAKGQAMVATLAEGHLSLLLSFFTERSTDSQRSRR
jgi:hypothetical protein